VALESDPGKRGLLLENRERLGLESLRPVIGDVLHAPLAPAFQRVLLDAPCSGWGTFRRHPDLKWRATPQQPRERAALQRVFLRSAAALCENGGVVVYSVCTFTREETDEVVSPLAGELGLVPEDGPEWLEQWKTAPGMYRLKPTEGLWDGYFLMRFRKRS
jgi:16S rRNA (cytosine967-C5)-methyltransferase